MSGKYKFHNPEGIYFVSFAVVHWVDVFTRNIYNDILIESLKHCITNKGLEVYCYVIMTNHVHLIIAKNGEQKLEEILRDLKKFTAYKIIGAIMKNNQESRKEWMIQLFEKSGKENSNNTKYQFWQQDNHPIELVNNEMIIQKRDYIHNNPVKAGIVNQAHEYVYSSAGVYSGKEMSLLPIKFLN